MIKITLTGRKKFLLYVTAGIVSIFLIEKVFFSGLRIKIRNLYQRIKQEEADLKLGIDAQKRKDKILKDYKDYKDYLVIEELSEKEIFTRFLKEIEKIAQESGLSIVNLTPQNEPVQLKDHKKYNADLRAEASMEKLSHFLRKIQDDSLLIKLDKLSLAPKDEQASTLKIEATISIAIP